jgi:hypothetical protein
MISLFAIGQLLAGKPSILLFDDRKSLACSHFGQKKVVALINQVRDPSPLLAKVAKATPAKSRLG